MMFESGFLNVVTCFGVVIQMHHLIRMKIFGQSDADTYSATWHINEIPEYDHPDSTLISRVALGEI